MARLLAIVAGGLSALVLVLSAGTASAVPGNGNGAGNGPPFDIVRGEGTFQIAFPIVGILDVSVTVDGMTKKGVTSGSFSATIRDRRGFVNIEVSGHLTCLRVDGNQSSVSGVVEQSSSGLAPLGSGILAMGIDNGDPGADGIPVDTVIAFPQSRPLTSCPEVQSAGAPLSSGDFVTHDGDFMK